MLGNQQHHQPDSKQETQQKSFSLWTPGEAAQCLSSSPHTDAYETLDIGALADFGLSKLA
jgi:hypothetical protein